MSVNHRRRISCMNSGVIGKPDAKPITASIPHRGQNADSCPSCSFSHSSISVGGKIAKQQ